MRLPPLSASRHPLRVVATCALLFGLGMMPLAAQATPGGTLDREGLFKAALESSATMANARTSLEAARDKATYAAAIWQSSLGLSGSYKDVLIKDSTASSSAASGAATAASGGSSTGLAASASLSVKPLSQIGVEASLDANLNYSASLSVKPFADNSQLRSAQQALADQELQNANAESNLKTSVYKAWASWAKAWRQKELAAIQLQGQERIAADRQTRYEAGALSGTDLDAARSDLLSAQKTLNDQAVAELQARFNLLSLCGLPLEQELQPPPAASADSLRLRAALVSAGKAVLKTDPSLVLAERALERANEDAKRLPGILSGIGLSAGLSGSAKSLNWQAGLSYSLTAASFSPEESASRARAIANATQSLAAARYQSASSLAVASQKLQGALGLAESAERQRSAAQATWQSEKLRFDSGASSTQKLADATLSLNRNEASADAAWWDLEIELLSWQE